MNIFKHLLICILLSFSPLDANFRILFHLQASALPLE